MVKRGIVEEEVILSGEAVEIIADFSNFEPLPKDDLLIKLVNDTALKGGERKTLSILVAHGNTSVCVQNFHCVYTKKNK